MEDINNALSQTQFPLPTNNETNAVSSYVSDYTEALESIMLWVLGKKKNIDGSVVEDKMRKQIMTHDQAVAYINNLKAITAKPIPFTNFSYDQAQTKIVFEKAQLRWILVQDWNLDLDVASQLMNIYDTFASAVLNGTIAGFTMDKITQHLTISELRAPQQEKKGGIGIPRIFKRGGSTDGNY